MDLYECRIQANLNIMSHTLLLTLPHNEAWSTSHFLQESLAQSKAGGNTLASCSNKVQEAVKELLDLLRDTAAISTINSFDSEDTVRVKMDELESFETNCQDLFNHFKYRNLEALIASVRGTLDNLRRCITTSTLRSANPYSRGTEEGTHPTSCFQADLILSLPNIVLQPTLEEMQNSVNQAVQYICEVGQHVQLWSLPSYSNSRVVSPRTDRTTGEWYFCITISDVTSVCL